MIVQSSSAIAADQEFPAASPVKQQPSVEVAAQLLSNAISCYLRGDAKPAIQITNESYLFCVFAQEQKEELVKFQQLLRDNGLEVCDVRMESEYAKDALIAQKIKFDPKNHEDCAKLEKLYNQIPGCIVLKPNSDRLRLWMFEEVVFHYQGQIRLPILRNVQYIHFSCDRAHTENYQRALAMLKACKEGKRMLFEDSTHSFGDTFLRASKIEYTRYLACNAISMRYFLLMLDFALAENPSEIARIKNLQAPSHVCKLLRIVCPTDIYNLLQICEAPEIIQISWDKKDMELVESFFLENSALRNSVLQLAWMDNEFRLVRGRVFFSPPRSLTIIKELEQAVTQLTKTTAEIVNTKLDEINAILQKRSEILQGKLANTKSADPLRDTHAGKNQVVMRLQNLVQQAIDGTLSVKELNQEFTKIINQSHFILNKETGVFSGVVNPFLSLFGTCIDTHLMDALNECCKTLQELAKLPAVDVEHQCKVKPC